MINGLNRNAHENMKKGGANFISNEERNREKKMLLDINRIEGNIAENRDENTSKLAHNSWSQPTIIAYVCDI